MVRATLVAAAVLMAACTACTGTSGSSQRSDPSLISAMWRARNQAWAQGRAQGVREDVALTYPPSRQAAGTTVGRCDRAATINNDEFTPEGAPSRLNHWVEPFTGRVPAGRVYAVPGTESYTQGTSAHTRRTVLHAIVTPHHQTYMFLTCRRLDRSWAGWVAQSGKGSLDVVQGSWREPSGRCNGTGSALAMWVGLGGSRPGDKALIQVGTMVRCVDGARFDTAWYEQPPQAPRYPAALDIAPGSLVTARIEPLQANQYALTISSAGHTWGPLTVDAAAPPHSAECIAERTQTANGHANYRLAPVTRIEFASCAAGPYLGTRLVALNSAHEATSIDLMTASNRLLLRTSEATSTGASTVARTTAPDDGLALGNAP